MNLDNLLIYIELFFLNFVVFRCNKNCKGEGVLVVMSGRIICNLWYLLEELEIEFLTFDIYYLKIIILILVCFIDFVK